MNLCPVLFISVLLSNLPLLERISHATTETLWCCDDDVQLLLKQSICARNHTYRKLDTIKLARSKNHAFLYISLILILNASDIESNPGPITPKYPCHICSKAVTWKQKGVACDDCQKWYHAECMHMTTPVYMSLNNVSWHCCNCGMQNFASSLFESSIDISSTNSFSSLEEERTVLLVLVPHLPARLQHHDLFQIRITNEVI